MICKIRFPSCQSVQPALLSSNVAQCLQSDESFHHFQHPTSISRRSLQFDLIVLAWGLRRRQMYVRLAQTFSDLAQSTAVQCYIYRSANSKQSVSTGRLHQTNKKHSKLTKLECLIISLDDLLPRFLKVPWQNDISVLSHSYRIEGSQLCEDL